MMNSSKFRILDPCPENYRPLVLQWLLEHKEQTLDDLAPHDDAEMKAKYEGDMARGSKFYGVESEDRTPVGCVWFENVGEGIFVGHLAFSLNHISAQARINSTRQSLRMVFSSGARKVLWPALVRNVIYINFLRKRIGAELEAVLRKQVRCKGEWMDVAFLASFPEEKAI